MPKSVAATPVKFTYFPDGAVSSLPHGESMEGTWEEFLEGVLTEIGPKLGETDKLRVPLIVPVEWQRGAPKKELQYVKAVCMGSLDFDGEEVTTKKGKKKHVGITRDQYKEVIRRIKECDLDALVYSTWSHHEVRPNYKIRVVVPLSRPVEVREWKRLWSAFNGLLGSIGDKSCKDPSRGYFWPSSPKGTEESDRILRHIRGSKALDVDFLLSGSEEDGRTAEQEAIEELSGTKKLKVSRKQIKLFAKKKSRSKVHAHSDVGEKLLKVVDGEAFAEDGERDDVSYILARELAREFPKGDAKSIAEHFSVSLTQMGEDAPTVEIIEEKIRRAQVSILAETAKKKRIEKTHREALPDQYSADYIDEFCKKSGSSENHESFGKHLIIQSANSYFVFDSGKYRKCLKSELAAVCRDAFVPFEDLYAPSACVVTSGGAEKPKTVDQLVWEYGTVATKHLMRLGVPATHGYREVEGTDLILIEAVTPRRWDLEPEYFEQVDTWLKAFCENESVYEMLLDWLAVFPDLTKPLAMLMLLGDTGVGKTQFASGLGRLWVRSNQANSPFSREAWTPMSEVFDNFNALLLKCPLVLADEELPRDHRGYVPTAKIRSMLGSNLKHINEKQQAKVELEGYLRFMATANNAERLAFGGSHNREDMRAINERLRMVRVRPESVRYFDYDLFVRQEAIAKHTLWLNENRTVEKHRYGVPQIDDTSFTAAYSDDTLEFLMDWCFQFLSKRLEEKSTELPAFVLGGRLCLNPDLICDTWDQDSNRKNFRRKQVRNVVRNIVDGAVRYAGKSGIRRRYYTVDKKHILNHAKTTGADPLYYSWQLQADTEQVLTSKMKMHKPPARRSAEQWRELAVKQVGRLRMGEEPEVEIEEFERQRPYEFELEAAE